MKLFRKIKNSVLDIARTGGGLLKGTGLPVLSQIGGGVQNVSTALGGRNLILSRPPSVVDQYSQPIASTQPIQNKPPFAGSISNSNPNGSAVSWTDSLIGNINNRMVKIGGAVVGGVVVTWLAFKYFSKPKYGRRGRR